LTTGILAPLCPSGLEPAKSTIEQPFNSGVYYSAGMMGSGKTTVGKHIADSLGYYFFDRYAVDILPFRSSLFSDTGYQMFNIAAFYFQRSRLSLSRAVTNWWRMLLAGFLSSRFSAKEMRKIFAMRR
jgi:adenylylsulfate kinase-like enzyme